MQLLGIVYRERRCLGSTSRHDAGAISTCNPSGWVSMSNAERVLSACKQDSSFPAWIKPF